MKSNKRIQREDQIPGNYYLNIADEWHDLWRGAVHLEHLAIIRGNKFKELLERALPYLEEVDVYTPKLIGEIEDALNESTPIPGPIK